MSLNLMSQALGLIPGAAPASTTLATNASGNYAALGFTPNANKTLSAVRAFVTTVNGSLLGSDIVCDLWGANTASGVPAVASQIETGKVPTATISAAGWYDFTGFSTAVMAGSVYWFVFRNVNASPAINNAVFRYNGSLLSGTQVGTVAAGGGWGAGISSNSGASWAVNVGRIAHRVAYSDGTYDGFPASNTAASGVGAGVYGARESGVVFTTPLNAALRVSGLSIYAVTKTGIPTGSPRIGLWTGSTPVNQGYVPCSGIGVSANGMASGYFASPLTIPPGTVCRITLAETSNSDASTARYNLLQVDYDTDANSIPLLPWGGTCNATYFDGSSWSDGTLGAAVYPHALILDSAGEFGNVRGPRTRNLFLGGGGVFGA